MIRYVAAFDQFVCVLKHKEIWLYLLPSAVISLFYYLLVYALELISSILPNFIEEALNTLLHQGYVFFALTLLSPVMGALSERTDSLLTNTVFKGGILRLGKDMLRAIGILVVSFFIYFALYLLWTTIAFLFHIQFLSSTILFTVSAFFIGYSFLDYTLERYAYSISESTQFAAKNALSVLVLGLSFSLIFNLPVVGVLFAPFLITLYATCLCIELRKANN